MTFKPAPISEEPLLKRLILLTFGKPKESTHSFFENRWCELAIVMISDSPLEASRTILPVLMPPWLLPVRKYSSLDMVPMIDLPAFSTMPLPSTDS